MFADREDAGRRLADLLDEQEEEADVVLAIPRGGLPVGREVADRLRAPLDVVIASKVGAPGNPELAVGAVAGDGSAWWNEDLLSYLGVGENYLEQGREREAEVAREKISLYRGGDPLPNLEGKRVIVVDDGVATGATARACLRQVNGSGAERVVLAVPVAPPHTVEDLEDECDGIVTVDAPEAFGAVGAFYRDFTQVTDEEAATYLDSEESIE
ncbi:phosphoribosyltransferase [Haloferax mediterranei ATCC 33500]|uniref:Phosphoribosyltransferase n=1 Tax=Haloferax mediterranei (strain ATCC 33500 / DSM 1411 / JCM 8866 / NBRC 14739 / NCIMB 2177 / R-4) TaxID=523841 RepID=I3R0U2_HALMT|nr:phosphoribosyltransferase family protein [Haloferax mediterranei]AFK17852.1 phosphoribosyltransferase [Haloferax mediterranei ATCC 33500]AHZ22725.1 phosphoribosyltransferase [Haloferax mediterranei ATCC 33500]EMA02875.1 phosphoribosyltransferase [Haloferax mediterranei ATCC 33500]MDX5987940.1 phosphoribosyltransferase family protein [Haloferax mediterranei ATCC 33500]QCQ74410.1 phosphoribosyltransferase [Haloferax mediterranei ATCC 33500]